eukprot:PhM_4_TR16580/c0_g1_i1/m.53286
MAVQELPVLIVMVVVLFGLVVFNGIMYLRASSRARHHERMVYLALEQGRAALARQRQLGTVTTSSLRAVKVLTQLQASKIWIEMSFLGQQRARIFYFWMSRVVAKNPHLQASLGSGSRHPSDVSPRNITYPTSPNPQNPLASLSTQSMTPLRGHDATPSTSSRFRFRLPTSEADTAPVY